MPFSGILLFALFSHLQQQRRDFDFYGLTEDPKLHDLVLAVHKFAEDRNDKTARYWRILNEVPTILMIVIVILVIVKPF